MNFDNPDRKSFDIKFESLTLDTSQISSIGHDIYKTFLFLFDSKTVAQFQFSVGKKPYETQL